MWVDRCPNGSTKIVALNVNGPTGSVRRLYYGIWDSVVLYAVLVWAKAVEVKKNRNILNGAQRAVLYSVSLSTMRAYGHYANILYS